jgi:hypothetical protein
VLNHVEVDTSANKENAHNVVPAVQSAIRLEIMLALNAKKG